MRSALSMDDARPWSEETQLDDSEVDLRITRMRESVVMAMGDGLVAD